MATKGNRMSITEAFYRLNLALGPRSDGAARTALECLDTIHAEMERLKKELACSGRLIDQHTEAAAKTIAELKTELEKARASCAEMREKANEAFGASWTNDDSPDSVYFVPSAIMLDLKQLALSPDCGTALLAEVKELREPEKCSVCGGDGKATSGECICGGSGLHDDEVLNMRNELIKLRELEEGLAAYIERRMRAVRADGPPVTQLDYQAKSRLSELEMLREFKAKHKE